MLSLCCVSNPELLCDSLSKELHLEGRILIVGEPKSRIVQKHTFFAPERYTAGIL